MIDVARPEGIAPEVWELWERDPDQASRRCDLYALWEALTALAQETRLQGRNVKRLLESLPDSEPLSRELAQLRQSLHGSWSEARREAQSQLLETLLEVRERLTRGRDCARQTRQHHPWLRWLFRPDPVVLALEDGYRLAADHLEETLRRLGVEEIPCQGQPFDPRTMTAVDVQEGPAHEDGRVLEVYRPGYRWHGQIHRLAQVKVGRNKERSTP